MIDVEWLRTLEFETDWGRITGLAGLGSQWIVFWHVKKNGEEVVLKVPHTPHLGWAIREVPPSLSATQLYDVPRLNTKLRHLVGNALLDGMCEEYDFLYAGILRILHREGLDGLIRYARDDDERQALAFLLHSPGMKRRLDDLALLDLEGSPPGEVVLLNNVAALEDTRENFVAWASEMLRGIEDIPVPTRLDPSQLSSNPLYVWGAAVLDGFFTNEEMDAALAFIAGEYGRLTARDDALVLGEQVFALQRLLARFVDPEKTRRFINFCSRAGFRVVDEQGNEVAAERLAPWPAARRGESDKLPVRIPKLAHPATVPRFAEEGHLDPFGQNARSFEEAHIRLAYLLGTHARRMHDHGVAVSLPTTSVPQTEWKPWRTVVGVDRSDLVSEGARKAHRNEANDAPDGSDTVLSLLQRWLVSVVALAGIEHDEPWSELAEALEHAGFLVLSREFDVTNHPQLNAMYEIGKIAARLHAKNCIHGDLHLEDFRFDEKGALKSMFDLGRACILDRELTLTERASDLAVLKKHCRFLEWEVARLGYRGGAPDIADAVFAIFDEQPQVVS